MGLDDATVLVLTVPDTDPVVGAIRREHDPSARDGMPAHVTVLTPFVPWDRWEANQVTRLKTAVAGFRPFRARFRRAGRFAKTTLFLVPEPEETFTRILSAVAQAFPEHPPYGGAFSAVLPHLTLAHGVPERTLDALESELSGRIDVRCTIEDLVLFSRTPAGKWRERARMPLPTR
jgi:2'-5' RNA ligase